MHHVHVAAAELNQTPLDWAGNERRIRAAIEEARRRGATVVCLPELCITGYGCEDAFHSPGLQQAAWEVLESLLPATKGLVVSLGLPVFFRKALYNGAAMCVDGRLVGIVAKRYLAGDGLHYEPRWFKPWPAGERADLDTPSGPVPIGDIHFDVGGVRIGFEICEDAWVASRPGALLAARGIDVILNPSASHFAFGKIDVRKRFVLEGSRAFSATYVYANLLGNESGRAIYDGGALIAHGGRLVASGRRFSFAEERVTDAVVDLDDTRVSQARTHSFKPRVEGAARDVIQAPFAWPRISPKAGVVDQPAWEAGPHVKEEEFARAVALGLYDYARKSRSTGFVISLSGGADSGAIACLVRLLVQLGGAELGLAGLLDKWSAVHHPGPGASWQDVVRAILVTAYQSTVNSGSVTRNAARVVAAAVGAEHLELDVDALVKGYVAQVSQALGRELTWAKDDVALQNIQARVRAPSVWMLANLRGALLVSTSNRSEAAVGYATMDGDTAGGLSPIAGIDKAFLRKWLRWLEAAGPDGVGPIPELAAINAQQPTAELRPPEKKQTDEDDLMPYELLDRIERLAVRDKKTPLECFVLVRPECPQYTPAQLGLWVERFFRMFCRNQWKRERYAPSFHLDDENLDPKTWCRFPILSGGYERELEALRAHVATLS
jgi:NAD+ synthase (glutamine-hydrolysing)